MTEDNSAHRWQVEAEESGLRLDTFLTKHSAAPSTASARRMVAAGLVTVNQRGVKKGYRLQPADVVEIEGEGTRSELPRFLPQVSLPVLYEDEYLVAVHKPGKMPSHPLRPEDGATAAGAIVARFPECAQASPDPREGGLAHRLDVGTSGVLIAARHREAWYRLRDALSDPGCEKLYLAEVVGSFPVGIANETILPGPAPQSYVVTAPIGRKGRRGDRVCLDGGRHPLPSRTEIRLLSEWAGGALVEARLAKGRTHQVRVHLAALGIPVAGDEIYGQASEELRLHARAVVFVHPYTAKVIRVEAPLPAWAIR